MNHEQDIISFLLIVHCPLFIVRKDFGTITVTVRNISMELDYKVVFKELNELGIDYLVVGGLAANLHGIPRMTYDIDLMILLESDNIRRLVSKLIQWGYKPKIPIDPQDLADESKRNSWIQDKGMKAFNFYSESLPIGEIDVIIDSPIPYETLKARAVGIQVQEVRIPIVSIHDLIELKLRAGRKQDLSDVEYLKIIVEK
jgi:predicted nucleotidyltransferase